jgi:hypothetical protein
MPELAATLSDLRPPAAHFVQAAGDNIRLGVAGPNGVTTLPNPLPASAIKKILQQLYPSAHCHMPVLVSGEDLGWLWSGIYRLPCDFPSMPGHRPPLYFVIHDLERLWVMLHLHEWRNLLADDRVRLFAGPGAFAHFRESLRRFGTARRRWTRSSTRRPKSPRANWPATRKLSAAWAPRKTSRPFSASSPPAAV